MPRLSALIVGIIALLLVQEAQAQSLRDRIAGGSAKVGAAVKNTAKNVDATVGSTIALAKNDETPDQTRSKLNLLADATLTSLFAGNMAAQALFDVSAGYAVFDSRRATVLGVVAGFGKGVAVSRETGARTYMNMGTGGVGLSFGIGGFESQVVILFQDAASFDQFILNGYDATAQAGSMVGDEKTDGTVRFIDGRSIYVLSKQGWKVSASAAGTKYWVAPDLN